MILPAANLIIYAHNQADPDHAAALVWWKSLLAGDVDVGIPIVVVLAFLRLTISPGQGHVASLLACLRSVGAWSRAGLRGEKRGAPVVTVNCAEAEPTTEKKAL